MNTSFAAQTKEVCFAKADRHPQLLIRRSLHPSSRNIPYAFKRLARHYCFRSLKCSTDAVPEPVISLSRSSKDEKPVISLLRSSKEEKPVISLQRSSKEEKPVGNLLERLSMQLPAILYGALLMVGIGLGVKAPAMAVAAPLNSKVSIREAVEKATQDTAERNASKETTAEKVQTVSVEESIEADAENKRAFALDEEFWKEVDMSKGSILVVLKNMLKSNPANRDALECLAKNLVDLDHPYQALTVIEKLELLEPDEMEWKYLKAFASDLSGQFQQAKQLYQEILKVEPFSSKAIQGLMMAMDELNETEALAEIIENTIAMARRANNHVEARNISMLIGQFYMMKGHLYDALDHYQEMLEEDNKDFRPHICLGIIYCALGEKAKAEQQFKAYEKFCPKDYPERKYLDALMRKAKKEGQKQFEDKQKEKYLRFPKIGKQKAADE